MRTDIEEFGIYSCKKHMMIDPIFAENPARAQAKVLSMYSYARVIEDCRKIEIENAIGDTDDVLYIVY